ncbi:MAG: helix-turn-helix domain-containing protein [Fluviibacter sp.]
MMMYRVALGDTLREIRTEQGRTLRDVSQLATTALGYLSEIERGQKEVSSEILADVAKTLGFSVGQLITLVGAKMMLDEGVVNPLSFEFDNELVNH